MENFENLPAEIKLEILTRVPTESLLECKLVSTTWRNIISRHPVFRKMHLHHINHPFDSSAAESGKSLGFIASTNDEKLHYFDYTDDEKPIQRIRQIRVTPPKLFSYDKIRFVGSCNGLICLAGGRRNVCICNPITKECVMLPEIVNGGWLDDNGLDFYWMNGFCYVSSTNEYKVLRVYVWRAPWRVLIYTLGSGSGWRDLGDFNSAFCFKHMNDAGILVNGALYWMDDELKMIGAFDFVEEKFSVHLAPPPLPPGSDWYDCKIGVLDGFLYFAASNADVVEGEKVKDIWLLTRKINGEHQSSVWSKKCRVVDEIGRLLAVTKNDGVLAYTGDYLKSYDTKASTSKRLVDFKERIRTVIPHKNTLVSLKELGEEDAKTVESVETEETKVGCNVM